MICHSRQGVTMRYITTLLILLNISCTPIAEDDDVFKTGKEASPPYGCIELRKRGGEC